ncbi:MAG: type VI secretion system contractile sheath large subunit [Planctomycetota bacterium]
MASPTNASARDATGTQTRYADGPNDPKTRSQHAASQEPTHQQSTVSPLIAAVVQETLRQEKASASKNESAAEATNSGAISSEETRAGQRLAAFFAAPDIASQLDACFGTGWRDDPSLSTADAITRRLHQQVAQIDKLLNDQVNAILHHPRFQKLESSWRGIAYLVGQASAAGDPMVKVRILNAKWKEIARDFDRASEFDQSQIFKKVYEEEFGIAGGHPFGLLIGDYSVRHKIGGGYSTDDVSVLRSMSGVAAAAFCPFLCAADAKLFDFDHFGDLEVTRDHAAYQTRPDYARWNRLREQEDARFLGVLLPRILMRGVYECRSDRPDGFVFTEDASDPEGRGYLWGNPAYAYASVVIRSFADSGWLADLRGLRQDEESGGLVSSLPAIHFPTDSRSLIPCPVTDVVISDALERQLSELGLIPLCDCKDKPLAVFASGQSLQKAKKYDTDAATANARISSMLPYMLTVSRFAHYVKILARNRTGGFTTSEGLQRILSDWIADYVTPDREASAEVKSRRPLREAEIRVREEPGRPGSFRCTINLSPHYELDDMVGSVRLSTTIAGSPV